MVNPSADCIVGLRDFEDVYIDFPLARGRDNSYQEREKHLTEQQILVSPLNGKRE